MLWQSKLKISDGPLKSSSESNEKEINGTESNLIIPSDMSQLRIPLGVREVLTMS